MKQKQRIRLASLGLLVLVFGAGVSLGLAWDRGGDARAEAMAPDSARAAPDSDRDGDGRAVRRGDDGEGRERRRRTPIWEKVDLEPAQKVVIDSIVDHHRGRMRDLQKEFRSAYNPRYWAIVDSTRSAIRDVMTASQAERYDSLLAEHDRKRGRSDDDDGTSRQDS